MRKDYQNLLMQYEDVIREKNELAKEASEIKINNYKLKSDYDKLLNDINIKIDKQEKEKKVKKNDKKDEKNHEKKVNVTYEDQILELKRLNKAGFDDGEKIARKKSILKDMAKLLSTDLVITYISTFLFIKSIISFFSKPISILFFILSFTLIFSENILLLLYCSLL